MPAPPGNQFWKLRSSHGRKPRFASPDELWNACCEYFEWVESNPLKAEKVFVNRGEIIRVTLDKLRPMTLRGLCHFIDVDPSTWSAWRHSEGFSNICEQVGQVIYTQKFEGAAAGLFNPRIIARELGLTRNWR